MVGHRALLKLIAGAVSRRTLPPSLLFVGPEGVGKTRAARALAQVQNCQAVTQTSELKADACGCCQACLKIQRGAFSDFLQVEPGDNGSITVDQVRQVIRQSAYRPFEGSRRVVVVRDAESLVLGAQNALLKTLEEPPDSSQFILVTSRPHLILPTVRSRTQQLNFGQLATAEVAAILTKEGVDERDGKVAAAFSGGSVGRALALASGELVPARDAAVSLLQSVSTARDDRQRLAAAKVLVGKAKAGTSGRPELLRRLRAMTSILRDAVAVEAGLDSETLANPDVEDRVRVLSKTYGGSRGVKAFATIGKALDAAERNVSPKVVADWLACNL